MAVIGRRTILGYEFIRLDCLRAAVFVREVFDYSEGLIWIRTSLGSLHLA